MSQNSTSGGTATHAGTNYQNRVAAWTAVHILAEQDATPPWDLPAAITLEALHAETPNAIDDLEVRTSAGGRALVQAKHTVNLETTPNSPLGKTISQFVAEYCSAKSPLDPTKDRFVLITSPTSSAKVRVNLPAFLTRLRTSSDEASEWTSGSNDEQEAARVLRDHISRAWRDRKGLDPTADELTGLIRLVRIHILDVDQGGQAEHEAKEHLRKSILADPTLADAAWSTLITVTGGYAMNAQRADRAALQRALTDASINIRSPRSFHEDIGRLTDYTKTTLDSLADLSCISIGSAPVKITRAVTTDLHTAAAQGHLLILGLPGAGKSGAVHDLATSLIAQGSDVLLFAVDQLDAPSTGALRNELGLSHELITILQAWPGTTPAYLIIDALDAARTDKTVSTLQRIIGLAIASNSRWHVIASVRKFDLQYNTSLQRLFHGTPPSTPYTDAAFPTTRHLNIPTLTDQELAQVQQQSPALAALMNTAPAPLLDLLRLPFNLRLLADLLGAGISAHDLRPVRTQVELLDRYWQERIIRHDGLGDARENLLRRTTTAMVAQRALRVPRSTTIGNETAASQILDDLLSAHVLAEGQTTTGTALRDLLRFPHHVLFDYAVARVGLPPEPAALVARLSQEPDLLIAIRPSIDVYLQRWWYQDTPAFWDFAFTIIAAPDIPEVGKLLAPSVAAMHATTLDQLRPLLDHLQDPGQQSVAIPALQHSLATLLAHGTMHAGPWIEFLDAATSATLAAPLAYSIRPYTLFLADHADKLPLPDRDRVGRLARHLLRFAFAQGTDPSLMVHGIDAVTKTITTDTAATVALLRTCSTTAFLAAHGPRTLFTLATTVPIVAGLDPAFVHDLYVNAFRHHETSADTTMMLPSQIFSLSSTQRQDYEAGLRQLGQHYQDFLQRAPREAFRALLSITEDYVDTEHHPDATSAPQPIMLGGAQTGLRADYSTIWDEGTHGDDVPITLLDRFQTFLQAADETTINDLFAILPGKRPFAVVWRRLLVAGTQQPATIGYALRSLGWDHTILTARDTTRVAGEFLRAIFAALTTVERERIEHAILAIPANVPPGNDEAAQHYRDRLLGCLDPNLLTTPEAVKQRGALGEHAPPNVAEFQSSFGAVSIEDLRAMGIVPAAETPNPIQLLLQPISAFAAQHLNSAPSPQEVADILPRMQELDAALANNAVAAATHPQALSDLADASIAVMRRHEVVLDNEALALLRRVVLRGTSDQQPVPDAKTDERFQERPSWGTAPRISAAHAITMLARQSMDNELEAVIRTLSTDPVAAVRYQIARQPGNISQTAPDLMWELLNYYATKEENRGVLQATLDTLHHIAGIDIPRAAGLTQQIFDRVLDGPGAKPVRELCTDLFARTYIWHNDSRSAAVIDRFLQAPAQYHQELSRLIFRLEQALNDPKPAIRDTGFALFARILDALMQDLRAREAQYGDQYGLWPADAQQEGANIFHTIDHAAERLYFASGAFKHGNTPGRPTTNEEIAAFYARAKPLLASLARIGHPHTAHHVIQTLEHLTPADPIGVLILLGDVVRTTSKHGYQREPLGEEVITRMIERYLAEYRPLLREHRESHKILLDILDEFVRVGWPKRSTASCTASMRFTADDAMR